MKKLNNLISEKPFIILGGTLIIGLLLGWLLFGGSGATSGSDVAITEEHVHKEGSTYTCSMHPQIRQDESGSCPICGMDLIPIEKDDSEGIDPDAVVLSASAMKIAEVETTVIEKRVPYKEVVLSGKVKSDERRITELTAQFPGRIEKLNVNFTGQEVRKGQVLATIYSPELVSAQKELLEAIKYKESNAEFYKAARTKLELWLFTDAQIDEIENSGKVEHNSKILSPVSGTVTRRNIAQGNHVIEGMSMFQIIDLNHLWVEFDAYESDIPWIKRDVEAEVSIKSVPGKLFKSKVSFIDPVLNEKTRTTIVRVELVNKSGVLKPGMFAQASVKSMLSGNKEAVLVPKSAVLWTGKKAVVYIKEDNGTTNAFQYREIILGEDSGSWYVVIEGLHEGEEVVTHGAFKIDAAAQLNGSQSMMNPEGSRQSSGGHAGMDIGGDDTGNEEMKMDDTKTEFVLMEVDSKFKAQFSDVVKAYLSLKDDFVVTDSKKVASGAKSVQKTMSNVKMELLKGDAHLMWMDMMKIINSNVDKIIKSSNIEDQRLAFSDLSDEMYQVVKSFNITGLNIYYQFCPMAKDNTGAYWLSLNSEIRNPYFGDKMLKCGEIIETLE
ncbi:MAG: efflux RND transporter periplasmic adaptor subunit [Bacteroidota bacterium]